MKVITFSEFEAKFEEIIDDCHDNNVHYKILVGGAEAIMLVPVQEFEVLQDVYEDWVAQPVDTDIDGFDQCVLNVVEPQPISYGEQSDLDTFS